MAATLSVYKLFIIYVECSASDFQDIDLISSHVPDLLVSQIFSSLISALCQTHNRFKKILNVQSDYFLVFYVY